MANRSPKRGKWIAVGVAALAAATLAGGLFASRDALVEWWWIRKLRSPEAAERSAAAEKLVALKSLRAVPHLIEAVRRNETEEIDHLTSLGFRTSDPVRCATPLVLALWRLGDPAVPALRAALEKEKQADPSGRMAKLLEEILDRDGPPLGPLVPDTRPWH